MALNLQQLLGLFQSLNAGQQSAFAASTPDMGQDERNQWINTYGPGGTNYGQFRDWYASGRPNSVGGATPMQNPTGISMTQGNNFAPAMSQLSTLPGVGSTSPGMRDPNDPNGGLNPNQQPINPATRTPGTKDLFGTSGPYDPSDPNGLRGAYGPVPGNPGGTEKPPLSGNWNPNPIQSTGMQSWASQQPGYNTSTLDPNTGYPVGTWHQQYSPGAQGAQSPEAQFAPAINSVGPGSPVPTGSPPPTNAVTPPPGNSGGGSSIGLQKPKGYSFVAPGWGQRMAQPMGWGNQRIRF